MGLRNTVRNLVYGPPTMRAWSPEFVEKRLSVDPDSAIGILQRLTATSRIGVWRRVSVREALGVPAIHRAVVIISSTTGMLSVQAYRNGVLMEEPPRLVTRPNPYETPGAFYGGTAGDMAKYGEFVWWIASKDADDLAAALVRVPLNELTVEENPDNRLMPKYKWGTKTGTRYSGANPAGRFVHVKYPLAEPFALRGEGPLQLCGVANSVAVESQNWAGNFYGEGGHPATVIKKAGILSATLLDPVTMLPDPDGVSEADILRNQVIGRSNNTAMVIDDTIDSIEFKSPNTVGAQMLDARQFNNGDAAREYGIPGPLLEYQQQGSSLTYQNRTDLKGHLLEMCLMPLYLEPIEQAMSDLLTRSTVARFNVKGFLRADIKTRFEVHGIAIDKGIYDPAYAQREEGIAPGDVEYAPAPFAAPAAIPSPITKTASMRDVRCDQCGRLIVRAAGPVEGVCRHCKRPVAA
jgi:phage portal protein BeeE